MAAALEAAGDLERAIVAYEELCDRAAGSPAETSALRAAIPLCRCYREAGDLDRAVNVAESALARLASEAMAGSDLELDLTLTLAMAHVERGDAVRAKHLLQRVERMASAMGTPRERGAAYWNAAVLAADLDERADAVWLIERAVALFGEGSDERNLARLHNAHAAIIMRADPSRAGEALAELQAAREALLTTGSSVDIAYCDTEIARALVLTGHAKEAVASARQALHRLDGKPRLEGARARAALAYALTATGEIASARQEYAAAASAMNALGARRQAAVVWLELAEVAVADGDVHAGLVAAQAAGAEVGLRPHFPVVSAHVGSALGRQQRRTRATSSPDKQRSGRR